MKATSEERSKLIQQMEGTEDHPYWSLSGNLFGDVGVDIWDFEIDNYIYFLDNIRSLEDLLRGLHELSPFADDALEVAKGMNAQNFYEFKLTLAYERRQEDSKMPEKYYALVLPKWFSPYALLLAEKAIVPLGATLIRLLDSEDDF